MLKINYFKNEKEWKSTEFNISNTIYNCNRKTASLPSFTQILFLNSAERVSWVMLTSDAHPISRAERHSETDCFWKLS